MAKIIKRGKKKKKKEKCRVVFTKNGNDKYSVDKQVRKSLHM